MRLIFSRIQKILFLFIAIGLQTSCQGNRQTSTLILAFESLNSQDLQCSEELVSKQGSGFAELCKNSVRFTHFYTSSTESSAAMASLLTGLYPLEHGLRTSNDWLRSSYVTIPESALAAGFNTSFFSGGYQILRKTNLHQGFKYFDDHIEPKPSRLFRPFKDVTKVFLDWLETDNNAQKFFSVLYISDLAYRNKLRANQETFEAALINEDDKNEVIDQQLFSLIQILKDKKLWNQTNIILLGLNGNNQFERGQENDLFNLHSERTQTALLIKPSSKPRDSGLAWKIDANVSMADLGLTIERSILNLTPASNGSTAPDDDSELKSPFEKISFFDHDFKMRKSFPENRKIPLESSYRQYHRFGIIADNYLYIENSPYWISFNSLTDRLELNPQELKDASSIKSAVQNLYASRGALASYTGFKDYRTDIKPSPELIAIDITCETILNKNPIRLEDLKNCSNEIFSQLILFLRSRELQMTEETARAQFLRQYKFTKLDQLIKKNFEKQWIYPPLNKSAYLDLSSIEATLDKAQYRKFKSDLLKSMKED